MATKVEKSCHLCHKPVKDIIQCKQLIGNNPCDCIFCPDCIKNEFNEDIYYLKRMQSTYICFRCRGLCECEECKKERERKQEEEPKPVEEPPITQPIQNPVQPQSIEVKQTEVKQTKVNPPVNLQRQNQKREELAVQNIPKPKKIRNNVFNHGDYSNHFVFHVAIYSSLSPSQGVTLNCVSTSDDIKTLEEAEVIPSFSYKYYYLLNQTIN